MTKSVFSALIGIAIGKGYIKNADQKVLDFFPHYNIKPGEKTIQIIPAEWIEESTKEHSRRGGLSYGYLWWVDDKMNTYAALGDGGNVIYINTNKKIVVSIASFFMPDAKDRIQLIIEHIEPVFENCT